MVFRFGSWTKSEMGVLGRLFNDFARTFVQKTGYWVGIHDAWPDFLKNAVLDRKNPKITLEPRKLLHCYS